MSPIIPVASLRAIALHKLCNAISFATTQIYRQNNSLIPIEAASNVKSYLFYLPGSIREDVLQYLLFDQFLNSWESYVCLHLVLGEGVKLLATGKFPQSYHSIVLEVIHMHGVALEYLDLRGVWLSESELTLLQDMLQELPHLRTLIIPHMATDQILNTIGHHCPFLHTLDISGENAISKVGFLDLCYGCGQILKYINVGKVYSYSDNIQPPDVALLLSLAPNLVSLGNYKFVGLALVHMSNMYKVTTPTKLQFLHDTFTSNKTLMTIIDFCPDLQGIYLDSPEDNVVPHLHLLHKLEYVKLHRFETSDLMKFLSNGGSKLCILKLISGRGSCDINDINRFCQRLKEFECYKYSLLALNKEITLENLVTLNIMFTQATTHCIRDILFGAHKLAHVTIGNVGDLTDEDMRQMLEQKCLIDVEALTFLSAENLSVHTLRMLIHLCPLLKSIGQLKGWNITQSDVAEVRYYIKKNNLNVRIHF